MLKETYFNRYKGWGIKPTKNDVIEVVMRSKGHVLSPSIELLNDYKNGFIEWNIYVRRFKDEMNNEVCKKEMKRIKELSIMKDVYLVCSCFNKKNYCHRYLLINMINEMR